MNFNKLLEEKRKDIIVIASRHGAKNIRLFGSTIRNQDNPQSDIDFLVDMEPGRSLLDHVALIQDLSDLLGRKVDVVTERSLHWYIRDQIIQESLPL